MINYTHTVHELNLDGADDLMKWIVECLEFDNSVCRNSISINTCATAHAWGVCYIAKFDKHPVPKDLISSIETDAGIYFSNGDMFEYLGDGDFDLHKRK